MPTINVNESNTQPIMLGIRGEKEVTEVVFDYSAWVSEFGEGNVSLLVKRSEDSLPYPVVLDVDTESHTATWVVSREDIRYKGRGECEWVYYVDEKIAKTVVYRTYVVRDIGEDLGEAPDPYESWLDTLSELGAEVQTSANNAELSAVRAEEAATQAESAVAIDLTVEVRHTSDGYLVVTPPSIDDLNAIISEKRVGICRVIMQEGVGTIGEEIGRLLLTAYSSTNSAEFIGYTVDNSFARLTMRTILGRKTWAYMCYEYATQDMLNESIQAVNDSIGEVESSVGTVQTWIDDDATPRIEELESDVSNLYDIIDSGGGTGGGAVDSVNGQTGDVVLNANDVSAIPNPTQKTEGQYLKWNGSAWVASTMTYPDTVYYATEQDETENLVYAVQHYDYVVFEYHDGSNIYYLPLINYSTAQGNEFFRFGGLYYSNEDDFCHYMGAYFDGGYWDIATPLTPYTKPSSGIPKSDLASAVKTSLGKADTAVQPTTEVTVSTAGAVTQALDSGKIYHFTGALTSLTITLNAVASGIAHYHFDFLSGSTAPTLTMPSAVKMPDSFAVEASKRYEVDVLNNYGAVISWANS